MNPVMVHIHFWEFISLALCIDLTSFPFSSISLCQFLEAFATPNKLLPLSSFSLCIFSFIRKANMLFPSSFFSECILSAFFFPSRLFPLSSLSLCAFLEAAKAMPVNPLSFACQMLSWNHSLHTYRLEGSFVPPSDLLILW